jgi:hypothetical protein
MTRRLYNERYAHDAQGNFIGTGRKAPDAGLMFIPSKSTDQDILNQVSQFAHARQHDPHAFMDGHGMMPIGGAYGGGGIGM